MKRLLVLVLCLLILPVFAFAEIIPHKIFAAVQEDIDYKSIKKGDVIKVISIENYKIGDNIIISEGDILNIKIKDYVKPKRGKMDGYYKVEYLADNIADNNGTMRISNPKDMESIVKSAGITVTGHILKVPGFSQAVAVSKGLIKPNENMSRIASAGKNLYQSTPLTYIEKGKNFEIEKDGIIVLKLKFKDDNQE